MSEEANDVLAGLLNRIAVELAWRASLPPRPRAADTMLMYMAEAIALCDELTRLRADNARLRKKLDHTRMEYQSAMCEFAKLFPDVTFAGITEAMEYIATKIARLRKTEDVAKTLISNAPAILSSDIYALQDALAGEEK